MDASLFKLLRYIWSAKRAESLSAEDIRDLEERRFRKLLLYAVRHSPFYRRLYKSEGITEENINSVPGTSIPIIDKKALMEYYDELVCDEQIRRQDLEKFIADPSNYGKKYLGRYEVIHTSGSSGVVGLFVYGPDDWTRVKSLAVARVSKGPVSFFRKTRLAFIGATGGHYAGVSLVQDAPKFIFETMPVSINHPLEDVAKALNEFYPDVLTGYASGVHMLAEQKRRGLIRISPKRIVTSADILTPEMRSVITQTFGTPPKNFYASSESLCMAAECESEHSLHAFTDWHRFEVLSKVGDPVPEGTPGNLVMTNLYNYTEPLIRYKMNDEVSFISKKCPCGSPFPKMGTIAGRQEDFLWFEKPNGTADYLHPILLVEFFVPGLKKFQFIQKGKNALMMKAILDSGAERESTVRNIKTRMAEILGEKGLSDAVVFTVEEADVIPNDPKTGKFKLVVPLKRN